jgi:hypothetical protein
MFMKQASDSYRRIAFGFGVKTCQNCLLLLLFKLICRVSGHDLRLQEIHLKKVRKNDHIGESMVTWP